MAYYEAARDKAIRAVDKVFAEEIGLYFLDDGRVDPSRENTTARAVLRAGSASSQGVSGRSTSWSSRIEAGQAKAYIARENYVGPTIRQGDKIRANERDGEPWFEVLRVDDRQHGRLILSLGAA